MTACGHPTDALTDDAADLTAGHRAEVALVTPVGATAQHAPGKQGSAHCVNINLFHLFF